MVNILLGILYGTLAVLLPVIALVSWSFVFLALFPYSKNEFQKVIFLKGADDSLRYIMIGMIPIYFVAVGFVSAGLSIFGELFFILFIVLFDPSVSPVSQVISVMSAGPIEESAKLGMSLLIYLTFYWIWRKVPVEKHKEVQRDTVKDGLIFGLFAGASFGFLESLLYLSGNFQTLAAVGPSFETIDPILWRFVLGVMIHALYTGIASAGLGRKTMGSKVAVTAISLSIAVILHALNNGIQGVFILILEMDNLAGWLITDALQGGLVIIGIVIFMVFWKTSKKGSGSNPEVYSRKKMQYR
jgi:RsiW-degrading membrane proteinase PrsW (M82 family)